MLNDIAGAALVVLFAALIGFYLVTDTEQVDQAVAGWLGR